MIYQFLPSPASTCKTGVCSPASELARSTSAGSSGSGSTPGSEEESSAATASRGSPGASTVSPDRSSAVSSEEMISSSFISIRLSGKGGKQLVDPRRHDLIHYCKVRCKGEYRDNHDQGGCAHLLPRWPGDAAHLRLQLLKIVLHAHGPTRSPLKEISGVAFWYLCCGHLL